jgi:hypothetical protein
MMGLLHRTPGRSWVAAWALLAGLLLGQPGFALGLLAGGGGDAGCDPACHCEEVADAGHDDRHDRDGDACPPQGSEEPCPPGCDDCTCCPGGLVAVTPNLAPCPASPPGATLLICPREDLASGVPGRIFSPPEPSLV